MSDTILMTLINLSLEVFEGIDEPTCLKIRRTLNSKRFKTRLQEIREEFLGQFPTLAPVRLTIS